jgi:hypothetical protein
MYIQKQGYGKGHKKHHSSSSDDDWWYPFIIQKI